MSPQDAVQLAEDLIDTASAMGYRRPSTLSATRRSNAGTSSCPTPFGFACEKCRTVHDSDPGSLGIAEAFHLRATCAVIADAEAAPFRRYRMVR